MDISRAFHRSARLAKGCLPRTAVLTRTTSQPTRGYVSCPGSDLDHTVSTMRYLQSTDTGWRSTVVKIAGTPMAVTDDGRATFLLYALAEAAEPSQVSVWLLRRDHSGATHRSRLATHLLTATYQEASVVARNGAWWAAWTELNGAGTWVWSAHTLGGTRKAYRSTFQGRSPSLLLQGDSVLLGYTGGWRGEGNTIYTAVPSGAGWRRQKGSVSGGAQPYDDVASYPQLARIGGKITVAYLKMVRRKTPYGENDLWLAVRTGTSWTRRSFHTTTAGAPSLIDAGAEPLLAWTAITPHYRGGFGWTPERQDLRITIRRGTRWRAAKVSLGTFPYLVAMRRHGSDLVAVVEDDGGRGLLLRQ